MKYAISTNTLPETLELQDLFAQTIWANERSIASIQTLLEKTEIYVVIRDEIKLIGFGRAISDGVYRALIDDIIIDENYRKKGLGGQIINELMKKLEEVEEVFLNTEEHLETFYEHYGFKKAKCLTMKF